jgi:hypothetical protein
MLHEQRFRFLDAMTLGRIMMSRQNVDQASLFYEFQFDDRVSKKHLLRRINVFSSDWQADYKAFQVGLVARHSDYDSLDVTG